VARIVQANHDQEKDECGATGDALRSVVIFSFLIVAGWCFH